MISRRKYENQTSFFKIHCTESSSTGMSSATSWISKYIFLYICPVVMKLVLRAFYVQPLRPF